MSAFYGSVVNRLMENDRYPEIVVGMGATLCYFSDRSPATVVAIRYAKDGKTVREIDLRGDSVSKNKRDWPDQDYDITPAPVAPAHTCGEVPDGSTRVASGSSTCIACQPVQVWRMDKEGRLRRTRINENGRRVLAPRNGGPGLVLGSRDYYSDPSF